MAKRRQSGQTPTGQSGQLKRPGEAETGEGGRVDTQQRRDNAPGVKRSRDGQSSDEPPSKFQGYEDDEEGPDNPENPDDAMGTEVPATDALRRSPCE